MNLIWKSMNHILWINEITVDRIQMWFRDVGILHCTLWVAFRKRCFEFSCMTLVDVTRILRIVINYWYHSSRISNFGFIEFSIVLGISDVSSHVRSVLDWFSLSPLFFIHYGEIQSNVRFNREFGLHIFDSTYPAKIVDSIEYICG